MTRRDEFICFFFEFITFRILIHFEIPFISLFRPSFFFFFTISEPHLSIFFVFFFVLFSHSFIFLSSTNQESKRITKNLCDLQKVSFCSYSLEILIFFLSLILYSTPPPDASKKSIIKIFKRPFIFYSFSLKHRLIVKFTLYLQASDVS